MKGIARRQIDRAGGKLLEGSSNVFVNGKNAVRIGDRVENHGKSPHNAAKMIQGSSTVFCNGKPICFTGCISSCSHKTTGSSNVLVGG